MSHVIPSSVELGREVWCGAGSRGDVYQTSRNPARPSPFPRSSLSGCRLECSPQLLQRVSSSCQSTSRLVSLRRSRLGRLRLFQNLLQWVLGTGLRVDLLQTDVCRSNLSKFDVYYKSCLLFISIILNFEGANYDHLILESVRRPMVKNEAWFNCF